MNNLDQIINLLEHGLNGLNVTKASQITARTFKPRTPYIKVDINTYIININGIMKQCSNIDIRMVHPSYLFDPLGQNRYVERPYITLDISLQVNKCNLISELSNYRDGLFNILVGTTNRMYKGYGTIRELKTDQFDTLDVSFNLNDTLTTYNTRDYAELWKNWLE